MEKRYKARWATPDETRDHHEHNGVIIDTVGNRRLSFVSPMALAEKVTAILNYLDHLDEDATKTFVSAFGRSE